MVKVPIVIFEIVPLHSLSPRAFFFISLYFGTCDMNDLYVRKKLSCVIFNFQPCIRKQLLTMNQD